MLNAITVNDVVGMIEHWLSVPTNGYHGSPYGADIHSLLQQPMLTGVADEFIRKMYDDIPYLKNLPSGAINVYFEDIDNDKKRLLIDAVGHLIEVG